MNAKTSAVTGEGSNAPRAAIAVKQGKFQAQSVTYNSKGVSIITPLSGWVSIAEAKAAIAKVEGGPLRPFSHEELEDERWSLRDEGRNPDGTGESYAERNV